jgi:type IV pilus assembly protein PilM
MERDRQWKWMVIGVEMERLKEGAIVGGRIEQAHAVIDVLRTMLVRRRMRKIRGHMAIPSAEVVARVHELQNVPDGKIAEVIAHELLHVKTVPFADPVSDFFPLKSYGGMDDEGQPDGAASQHAHMVIVAPQKLTKQYQDVCIASGIVPVSMEIRPLAIYRLLAHLVPDVAQRVMLVIDVQSRAVEMSLFVRGEFHITRYVAMTFPSEEQDIGVVIEGVVRQLAALVQQFTNYYRFTLGNRSVRVDEMVVLGEVDMLSVVAAQLATQIGIPVCALPPWEHGGKVLSADDVRTYAVALGLALRGGV